MGVWICSVDYDDGAERAVILDSVTERPLSLPLFRDEAEAEDFLDFVKGLEFQDVRELSPGTLERIHVAWLADREADALFAATSQQE